MGTDKTQRLCTRLLTCSLSRTLLLTCSLSCALLATARPLSDLRTDTPLCQFCPLLTPGRSSVCQNITTQCQPGEVCVTSRGQDGAGGLVSAQGCIRRALCGSHELRSHRGRRYDVSHTCCCGDLCNHKDLKLLGVIKGTKDNVDVQKQLLDSCKGDTM